MIWLTWRQHRIEILIMGLILLAIAAVLLATGLHIEAEARNITICLSRHTDCLAEQAALDNYINQLTGNASFLVLGAALPVLAGIFIGAPVIARELEQGTHHMIWTQGISWQRWLLIRLGLLFCVVLCSFGILFGLLTWWSILAAGAAKGNWSIDFSTRFDGWGIVLIAYALFALLLGIFAGTVLRRTVPAMAVTLIIFVLVRVLIVNFGRPYFFPPMTMTTPANSGLQIPAGAWIFNIALVDRQGHPLPDDALQACENLLSSVPPTNAEQAQYDHCITEHGFQYKATYQPADRFWPLQGIESSIYLFLTFILFALTFWWIKYRIIGNTVRFSLED